MAGRSVVALVLVALALSLSLLFGSSEQASAETWKVHYNTSLSCGGDDANGTLPGDVDDDSCVTPANQPGKTADVSSQVNVDHLLDGAPNKHSNYATLRTLNTPAEWIMTRSSAIPDGSLRARLTTTVTLAILNGPCTTSVPINIPLFDATTNTNNTVDWAGDGDNLLADPDGNGFPAYIDKYPNFLKRITDPDFGIAAQAGLMPAMKPAVRLAGHTFAQAGAPASKLEFLIFDPGALGQFKSPYPDRDLGDTYGYINVVQLDNPEPGSATPSPISDFCEPLATNTMLYGTTQGQGVLAAGPLGPVFDVPNASSCASNPANPLCGAVAQRNPADNTGIWGGDTHLTGVWATSGRDFDGDGINNNEDGCPLLIGTLDTDGDGVEDVCDPNDPVSTLDIDSDGFQNRQDNCPLLANPSQADSDVFPASDGGGGDGMGDACDPNDLDATTEGAFAADFLRDALCLGTDTDLDGWCDDTESKLGPDATAIGDPTDANQFPEYRALSPALAGPPTVPGVCSDLAWYVTAGDASAAGGTVDNDGDGQINAADGNCPAAPLAGDADSDGVPDSAATTVSVASAVGDISVTVAALPSWVGNGVAFSVGAGAQIERRTVLTVSGNTVTFGTTLTAASGGGATSVTVANTTGLSLGQLITIAGETGRRIVSIAGNVVTIDVGLASPHNPGDPVTPGGQFKTQANILPFAFAHAVAQTVTFGDNCRIVYNPEQLNTDLDAAQVGCTNGPSSSPPGCNTGGDACDLDADGDGYTSALEYLYGGQPKNGARYDQAGLGLDFNGDTITNSNDTFWYAGVLLGAPAVQAGTNP
jgi:hypothetical protein